MPLPVPVLLAVPNRPDNAARFDEVQPMLAAAYRGETLEECRRNQFGKD
jgi:hypothetical protein